jgi:branched-chain amino acid transport system substrate-binding protein
MLKASGADAARSTSPRPKFAAMAIRKVGRDRLASDPVPQQHGGLRGLRCCSRPGSRRPLGIITTQYLIDPTDPRFQSHPSVLEWKAFMAKYYPDGNLTDSNNMYGYVAAQALVQVLRQCGDDLTRANVMRQAASLRDYGAGGILPGIKINTSADDFAPIQSEQLVRFDGKQWVPFGESCREVMP